MDGVRLTRYVSCCGASLCAEAEVVVSAAEEDALVERKRLSVEARGSARGRKNDMYIDDLKFASAIVSCMEGGVLGRNQSRQSSAG